MLGVFNESLQFSAVYSILDSVVKVAG